MYGDGEQSKGTLCQLSNYDLSAPNGPFISLPYHARARALQTAFLLCQPVSCLSGSDTRNTGWKLESTMGGWGGGGQTTSPCYSLSLLSTLFQHRTWWQQLILIVFSILFCLFSIPRTSLTELLRSSNTSQAAPLFRDLSQLHKLQSLNS